MLYFYYGEVYNKGSLVSKHSNSFLSAFRIEKSEDVDDIVKKLTDVYCKNKGESFILINLNKI